MIAQTDTSISKLNTLWILYFGDQETNISRKITG